MAATKAKAACTDQPADLVAQWIPLVRRIEPNAEIDFSFGKDAITICDMSRPSSLRYGNLFTRTEIADHVHKRPGELERRVREFMARG